MQYVMHLLYIPQKEQTRTICYYFGNIALKGEKMYAGRKDNGIIVLLNLIKIGDTNIFYKPMEINIHAIIVQSYFKVRSPQG